MHPPISKPSPVRGVQKPSVRLFCGCLALSVLFLSIGCTKRPRSAEHVEVTGKVLFEGNPLPGGRLTFIAANGGFSSTGTIEKNGTYRINAPVGEVKIGVDNRMLQQGRSKPKQTPHPKRPDQEAEQPIKGRWVRIPTEYADPERSGLTYTVTSGPQTHDIQLKDKAPAPPSP